MNKLIQASFLLGLSMLSVIASATDGVKLITHSKVLAGGITPGDAPGYPATLSRRGHYQLASNLHVSDADTHAIQITTEDVTLNLNGHTIRGPGVAGSGVGVYALIVSDVHAAANTTVTNGTIREMGGLGVIVGPGSNLTHVRLDSNRGGGARFTTGPGGGEISHNVIVENGGDGLLVGTPNSLIADNVVAQNEGYGIYAEHGAIVRSNRSYFNFAWGVWVGNSSLVTGNTVTNNLGPGIRFDGISGYSQNVISGNELGGANRQIEGDGVQIGTNLCGQTICP